MDGSISLKAKSIKNHEQFKTVYELQCSKCHLQNNITRIANVSINLNVYVQSDVSSHSKSDIHVSHWFLYHVIPWCKKTEYLISTIHNRKMWYFFQNSIKSCTPFSVTFVCTFNPFLMMSIFCVKPRASMYL